MINKTHDVYLSDLPPVNWNRWFSRLRRASPLRQPTRSARGTIKEIRYICDKLSALEKRLKPRKEAADEVVSASQALAKKLTAIEEALYQTKARSPQDVLNYPIRLNN
jgi:hypothetical protein